MLLVTLTCCFFFVVAGARHERSQVKLWPQNYTTTEFKIPIPSICFNYYLDCTFDLGTNKTKSCKLVPQDDNDVAFVTSESVPGTENTQFLSISKDFIDCRLDLDTMKQTCKYVVSTDTPAGSTDIPDKTITFPEKRSNHAESDADAPGVLRSEANKKVDTDSPSQEPTLQSSTQCWWGLCFWTAEKASRLITEALTKSSVVCSNCALQSGSTIINDPRDSVMIYQVIMLLQ